MTQKKEVDLLVFDLDGTLIDSLWDIADSLNFAAQKMGYNQVENSRFPAAIGNGVRMLIHDLLGIGLESDLMLETQAHFMDYYSKNLTKKTIIFENVEATLAHFSDKKLAVLSNKPDLLTKGIIEELGWSKYFFEVIGLNEQFPRKPHPSVLQHIIQQANTTAQRTVMIGDGDADMMVGKNAGTMTCAVAGGFRSRSELESFEPDFFIDNLIELKKHF